MQTVRKHLKIRLRETAFFLLLLCPFIADAFKNEEWSDGIILAASRTGNVAFTQNGKYIKVPRNGELKNKNCAVLTGKDSNATILFSSGMAIELQSESSLEISHYRQERFISSEHDLTHEPSRSITELKLTYGTFIFTRKIINPTSKLALNTPFAVIHSHSEKFVISIDENSTHCVTLDRNLVIDIVEQGKKDYIQKGQTAVITKQSLRSNNPIKVSSTNETVEITYLDLIQKVDLITSRHFFNTSGSGSDWKIEPWFILPISKIPE